MLPIYIRITSERHKVEISTGSFIKPTDWNTTKHSVKPTADQADKINSTIKSVLSKIHKIHTELVATEKTFALEVIKNNLTGKNEKRTTLLDAINYHNELINKGIGKNYALGTYKGYLWFTNKVKSFLKHQYNRNDILLTELNHRFLTEFEHYLFHSLHNQVNTVQKNITQLRKIVNLCIDLDWLDKDAF